MANYQSLKAAINAVIKANGNKEITGTVLNEVLLAMVNSLGAGYQFAGVATPDTTPGTPDQKVFYIASQAGTYTNFGGAVVSDGIAIFKWNDTWSIEILTEIVKQSELAELVREIENKQDKLVSGQNIKTINGISILGAGNVQIEGGGGSISIDPTPTNGSPNAVASGGVYNAIKAITDFLNNGYYFVGIAGTSTEPDSVTQYGIFYIASDGGTYTNFLNGDDEPLTLYQGLNILYKGVEDDGWNYFEVFKFSDFVDTTQQQSLSSQQKAQARTNIAAVSYEQQSLNAGQQVQAQNNMMGKSYVPAQNSGLGKVYLDKNNGVLTQAMMQAANTVYVIQYDYTMSGNITLPVGCILEFDGGSISSGNYTLTGNNTRIKAERTNIFPATKIAGTWNVGNIYSEWFGDVTQNNNIKKLFALTDSNVTNNVYIVAETYNVSALVNDDAIITPKSNTIVHLSGTIQLAANGFTNYRIINIENVSNVTIDGGTIIGDRDTHTGTTGEWGMGISIGDAHDIIVKNVNVTKCWGDGIYVGGSGNTYNISIDSFTVSDCRRQGISITEVDNATINNGKISKIDGTSPKACIDIEPNANDIVRNISISNCVLDNGQYNGLFCAGLKEVIENVSIKNTIILSRNSFSPTNAKNLTVENCTLKHSINVIDCTNVSIISSNLQIVDMNLARSKSVKFTACHIEYNGQQVAIRNCFLESCRISMSDYPMNIYCDNQSCTIETNRYIDIRDNVCKDLTVITTKGGLNRPFPIYTHNTHIQNLNLTIIDSEEEGTYRAYIAGNKSEIDGLIINSEVSPSLLCFSDNYTVLKNVSFADGTTENFAVNSDGISVVVPFACKTKGTTAERPDLSGKGQGVLGFEFFDLTLGKPTYWTGNTSGGKSGWVDATGTDVPNT